MIVPDKYCVNEIGGIIVTFRDKTLSEFNVRYALVSQVNQCGYIFVKRERECTEAGVIRI